MSGLCHACGETLYPAARFCAVCGAPIAGTSARATPLARGERRNLTVLFADLVGSTEMIDGRDPEDLIDRLAAYRQAIRGAVEGLGGFILHHLGDGVVVCFGYPLASENAAESALHAALGILAAVRELGARGGEKPMQVRVGVASGVVVGQENAATSRIEDNFTGVAFNVAARVQGLAAPGEAVVAGSTARLIGGAFELQPLGAKSLKGFAEPVETYRLVRPREAQSRIERRLEMTHAPMVDRTEERGLIRRLLGEAASDSARFICLVGEAGIGKSRLANVLHEEPGEIDFQLLNLQCNASLSNTVLHPHVDLLRRQCGFVRDETPRDRLMKLQAFLSTRPTRDPEAPALLASLLSIGGEDVPPVRMSPPEQRARTLGVIQELLLIEARNKPLVVVYEDLHWADPTSRECLNGLVASAAAARMLLIGTTRPGAPVEWIAAPQAKEMQVGRIGSADSTEIAASLCGGVVSEIDLARIAERAEGVPLFIEEMTRMVLEAPDRGARVELPETLSDLLRERLDRLGPARVYAQIGAVLGREFSREMLATLADMELAALDAPIGTLLQSGLVEPAEREGSLIFKHALIQDAAYDSLLGRARRDLHARAAAALIELFPNTAERQPEAVARHLTQAGSPLPAADWWLKAGGAAIGRGSAQECAAALQSGLDALAAAPEGEARSRAELGLLAMLGPAQMVMKGPGARDFGAVQQRAYDICRALPDAPVRFPVTYGLALYLWGSAQFEKAAPLAAELDDAARADPTREHRLAAGNMNGMIRLHLGDPAEARRRLTETTGLYQPELDAPLYPRYLMDFGVFGRFYLGIACALTGDGEQGARHATDAAALAEALNQPHSLGFSMLANFIVAMLRGDVATARDWASRCVPFASRMGFPEFVAFAHIALGWAEVQSGDAAKGLAQLERGVAEWSATGFETWQTWFGALRMEALNRLGRPADALAENEAQLARAERNGERVFLPALARARTAAEAGV